MTHTNTGWILDVYIEDNEAVLWIKTEDGNVLKLFDTYEPVFYIQPKNENLWRRDLSNFTGSGTSQGDQMGE